MNSWCAQIAYVAGKRSQALFLYLKPARWAHYGIAEFKVTPIGDRGQGMFHGRGHRRAQQARLTPGSFMAMERSHSQEAALLWKSGVFFQTVSPWHHNGWWSAGAIPLFRRNKNNTEAGLGTMKCNSKSVNLQKSVPLSTHIWNFCFPRLNYNVINFVNNNYIFHYRIARKGRCKTLSQDSPLSCLVSVCLFN